MDWYEKLVDYFPENEMKNRGQMNELLEQNTPYHKAETEEYLVTYAEFPTFIFIDYLLVNPNIRSKGIGSKILQSFKKREKTIILEVEPPDMDDSNTIRRIHFYEKNGFQKAEHILYTLTDDDGETYTMDVYYWSPKTISEQEVMREMAIICRDIHNFKAKKYYGRLVADPTEVLEWEH